jgi:hypothetical protein
VLYEFGWTVNVPLGTFIKLITSNTGVVAVKQQNLLLKMAAGACSLLLAGGFISYRAGALDWLMGSRDPSSRPIMIGGSKSKVLIEGPSPETTDLQPHGTVQGDLTIMSSSKSIVIAPASAYTPGAPPAATPQQPPADTAQRPPTIMYGSKAGIFVPAPSSPVTPPPTPAEQPIPPPVPAADPPSSRLPVANQPSKPLP